MLDGGGPAKLPLNATYRHPRKRQQRLFAAVLLVFVVLVRAFQGQLPQELSGRGVKYAEREGTEEIRDAAAAALEGLQTAQQELAARVEALEGAPEDEDQSGVPQEREEG